MNNSDILYPRFSIIIPSFNQGHFLERTLLSILNQNYQNTEIIIIDGGSSDETVEVIRKYEKHITYWCSEPDEGQSHALNKGFARATGDIFGWLNSDDLYMPGAFALVADVFKRQQNISVCYGNWCSIDENDMEVDITYALKARIPRFHYENINSYNQTIFWRKEVHQRFGSYDEKLHRIMDNDMIIRFLLNEGPEKFHLINETLGAFRLHGEQKTSATEIDKTHAAEEKYIEKKFGFAPKKSLAGRYYRLSYRFFQLRSWLRSGGLKYVLRKIQQGHTRRKELL